MNIMHTMASDACTTFVPQLDAPDHHRMPQIMYAWPGMLAPSTPAQLISQPGEHVVDPAQRQRAARQRGEYGRFTRAADEPLPRTEVVGQSLHNAGVQG